MFVKLFFQAVDFIHVLGKHRMDGIDFSLYVISLRFCFFDAFLALRVVVGEFFKAQQLDIEVVLKDCIAQRPVLDGFFRLYLQYIIRAAYLAQYPFHLAHIFFGFLQFALRFGAAFFKPCNTCRLFKQIAAVFRLAGKNLVYLSLLHD